MLARPPAQKSSLTHEGSASSRRCFRPGVAKRALNRNLQSHSFDKEVEQGVPHY